MPPLTAAQKRQREKDKKRKQKELEQIRSEHAAFDAEHGALGSVTVTEQRSVLEALRAMNRSPIDTPADGNCLFHALQQQMQHIGGQRVEVSSAADLRRKVAQHILDHSPEYAEFVVPADAESEGGSSDSVDRVASYCESLSRDGVYGGELELRAAADLLGVCIVVVTAQRPLTFGTKHVEGQCQWILAYYQHLYTLGAHYCGTIVVEKEIVKNEKDVEEDEDQPEP